MLDQFEIDVLADLVVTRAQVDKTVPDSDNLRKGWRTDELLTGDVDLLVVGQRNDPAAYAEIGRRVLVAVEDLPEMKVLANLAILRGERLLPLTPEQEQIVIGLSDELKAAISTLPDGTRKQRCQELLKYHMAVFESTRGDFDLAAKTHELAAEKAGEGSSSAAISLFLSAFYRLKSALVAGKPSDELEVIFSDLEEKFAQMVKALRGSDLEVQWAEGNGPIQMILACTWLERAHPEWDNWVATARAAAEKLGKAWEPAVEFVLAADNNQGEAEYIEKALQAINVHGGSNEIKATTLLLLAHLALQDEDKERARNLVGQMPKQGAQHVRAIAERMVS